MGHLKEVLRKMIIIVGVWFKSDISSDFIYTFSTSM